ncbi:hypothetical protein QBC35DRAFT_136193 [Podospora australis]|uniref:Uncharacterized protein n=1 Tax=Podospora australis TaxID=1536484 RepID=A0AAN7AI57_9PEZI|nr:hypothetical protein QBC35DRAFT_136193 [Podospora australis]
MIISSAVCFFSLLIVPRAAWYLKRQALYFERTAAQAHCVNYGNQFPRPSATGKNTIDQLQDANGRDSGICCIEGAGRTAPLMHRTQYALWRVDNLSEHGEGRYAKDITSLLSFYMHPATA